MARLAPCPSCRRHVKLGERACPFCQVAFSAPLVPVEGDGAKRLPRVAAIALAAGVATTAACTGGAQPAYGVAMDGGDEPQDDAGEAADAGDVDDAGATEPLYGVAQDGGG